MILFVWCDWCWWLTGRTEGKSRCVDASTSRAARTRRWFHAVHLVQQTRQRRRPGGQLLCHAPIATQRAVYNRRVLSTGLHLLTDWIIISYSLTCLHWSWRASCASSLRLTPVHSTSGLKRSFSTNHSCHRLILLYGLLLLYRLLLLYGLPSWIV